MPGRGRGSKARTQPYVEGGTDTFATNTLRYTRRAEFIALSRFGPFVFAVLRKDGRNLHLEIKKKILCVRVVMCSF